MNKICDLHTHTTASDGQYTPAQLVRLAKDRGIEVLAVTDHDTVAGVDEAMAAGEKLGLRVIRGVELSALCGVGRDDLGLYERGKMTPRPGTVEKVSPLEQNRHMRQRRAVVLEQLLLEAVKAFPAVQRGPAGHD